MGLADQLELAVNHRQRPFRAGGHANPAAVALFFIDFDDFSNSHVFAPASMYASC
jgi:hypothetical protein